MILAGAVALLLARPAAASPSGSLVVCDDVREPATLDPQKEFSEKSHTIVQQVFEGLVRFGPDGAIEPALAERWERIDPLRMRFHLRPGVVFQDGEPFGPEAVRFSIARYLDPATGSLAAGFLSPIERAVVVDSSTVDIVTSRPDGLLLNRLAGFVLIAGQRALRERGASAFSERPVGTGAFRVERWDHGRSIVLAANERYWAPGRPRLRRLEFRFVPAERQLDALRSGEVDLLTDLPGTRSLEARDRAQLKLVKRKTAYTIVGNFQTGSRPLADVRVRRAMNYAIDKADLVRYGLFGNGAPLASLTLEGEPGFDPSLAPYPYDPERARRLLTAAGYPSGLALKTLLKSTAARAGKIIAAQLARVGVRLELVEVSDGEIAERMRRERFDFAIADNADPMLHPFFFQAILLYSKSPYSWTRDAAYDRMLERMSATLEPAEQAARLREIDRYVHDQALSLFTYQPVRVYAMARDVRFVPYLSGMPYFFDTERAR